MNEMSAVIHRFGIVAGETLTVDQMKAMTFAVKAGELKVEHFKQVAAITKSFNSVAVEAAKSLTVTVESAGKAKQSAIDAIKEIAGSLERIAIASNDPGVQSKVIDCLMKRAEKVEKADERNHNFFMTALLIGGSIVLSVVSRRPIRLA